MAMEGAQRALWGASSNLTDIGESINESVAMHMPYLFKGAPGVLDGKDSSRLVVGTVPSHYSSTPSINSFDSLECRCGVLMVLKMLEVEFSNFYAAVDITFNVKLGTPVHLHFL